MNWQLVKKANHQCWRAWLDCIWPRFVTQEARQCTSIEYDAKGTLYRMDGRTRIRVGEKRR